eukprot:TRINITY_DN1613_c0_g1_i5.p1 TRINITY_DN1613_c0_g1~~TRINITY_DN1613_c0_g1_i5.p1  ORF type:complete len:131 (-),score=2.37 TRINITY_DN1613_c0_g1_i5:61-453(-)
MHTWTWNPQWQAGVATTFSGRLLPCLKISALGIFKKLPRFFRNKNYRGFLDAVIIFFTVTYSSQPCFKKRKGIGEERKPLKEEPSAKTAHRRESKEKVMMKAKNDKQGSSSITSSQSLIRSYPVFFFFFF